MAGSLYVLAVAPEIAVQPATVAPVCQVDEVSLEVQTNHWIAVVGVGVPLQVPTVTLSVLLAPLVPVIAGIAVARGTA